MTAIYSTTSEIITDTTIEMAMVRAQQTQSDLVPVTADNLRPLVQTFLEKLTPEQWTLIKVGTPDDATLILMAELIVKLINAIIDAVLAGIRSIKDDIKKETILHCLTNTMTLTFTQVLEVPEDVQSTGSSKLAKLMAKEVAERINSTIASQNSEEPIKERVTPPSRLNTMINHFNQMLSDFMCKGCLCITQRAKSLPTTEEDDHEEEEEGDETMDCPVVEKVKSNDSMEKVVQDILKKEVDDIMHILLNEVEEDEYDILQSESSLNIEIIGEYVARSIMKESQSSESSEAGMKLCLEKSKLKIRSFLSNLFAMSCINKMVAQLRETYQKDKTSESSQSIQSLICDIETLLIKADVIPSGDELPGTKSASKIEDPSFSRELCDLIYSHLSSGSTKKTRSKSVPRRHTAIYSDIGKRVKAFLSLMKWWSNMRVSSHSNKVMTALMNSESFSQTHLAGVSLMSEERPTSSVERPLVSEERSRSSVRRPLVSEEGPRLSVERPIVSKERSRSSVRCPIISGERSTRSESKHPESTDESSRKHTYMSVGVIIEKLMARISRKSKMAEVVRMENIINDVFEAAWTQVEDEELTITKTQLEKLDKYIYKDLCKKWGCAENMMLSFKLDDPVIETFIAASLKHHLMTKRKNVFHRFLSTLGNVSAHSFPLMLFGVVWLVLL